MLIKKKKKKANLAVAYFFSRSKFFGFCLYSLVPIENFIKEKKLAVFKGKLLINEISFFQGNQNVIRKGYPWFLLMSSLTCHFVE